MKHRFLLFSLLFILICLTGCSGSEDAETQPTDTEVNVATFDQGAVSVNDMYTPMLVGDSLYYWKGDWDKDSRSWSNTAIYRKGGGDAEAVEIAELANKELLCFIVDEQENLYYFFGEYDGEEKHLFLKKAAADGSTVYEAPVASEVGTQILSDIEENGYLSQGAVNSQGEVVFRSMAGNLYLFNEDGEFVCTGKDGLDGENYQSRDKGLVNAGDAGVFAYVVVDNTILLSKINMTKGSLDVAVEVKIDTEGSLDIYSGYDRGILVSDGTSLWVYDLTEKALTVLLGWGDEGIGLKNYDISQIGMVEDGRFYVIATRLDGRDTNLVYIEAMEASAVVEKQTIVIGSYETLFEGKTSELEVMAEQFNKYSKEYQVEIKHYEDSQEMYLELLKGEGPDGFQLAKESSLAAQGLLADLSPYFAESNVVQESDLLPSVRNAGYKDGKLLYVFTQFNLKGLVVKQGTTENGVWTPEEYLALGERYPEALLTPQLGNYMVMWYALSADMDSFVDWDNRECFFDSERFIHILESVRQVTQGKTSTDVMEWRTNACQWLHDRETLTEYFQIGDVRGYVEYRDAYEDFAEFAGYPNSKGTPYYLFEPDYVLAMNSVSDNKDGVWAFLEYLLSWEYQSSVKGFPVRQDAFDAYITEQFAEWERRAAQDTYSDMNSVSLVTWQEYPKVSEEDRETLKNMVDNAYWSTDFDEMWVIFTEEAGSFWAGDKTAEEVAGIIQNRVTLYLSEL